MTIVEEGSTISKNEVNIALYAAGLVVLPHAVRVEGVLVSKEFAIFDDGAITVGSECDGLVGFGAGGVLEGYTTSHESISDDSYKDEK